MTIFEKFVTATPNKKRAFFDIGGSYGDPNVDGIHYFVVAERDFETAAALVKANSIEVAITKGMNPHEADFFEDLAGIQPWMIP